MQGWGAQQGWKEVRRPQIPGGGGKWRDKHQPCLPLRVCGACGAPGERWGQENGGAQCRPRAEGVFFSFTNEEDLSQFKCRGKILVEGLIKGKDVC